MKNHPLPYIALRYLLCLIAVAWAKNVKAQNVTLSPETGQLIAAYTYEGESGFENGWSALWRHNQLPLTLTVSDKPDLTESGKLMDPAGNISLDKSQKLYVINGGTTVSTHINISLPNGYRFTGYRIVLLNNLVGKTINGMGQTAMRKQLIETDASFDTNNKLSATEMMPETTGDAQEYVIERTSKADGDMGNQLYFYFWHEDNGYYGATIKSCELYFTADDVFETMVTPMKNGDVINNGVNFARAPFATSKLDLGAIEPHTRNGKTVYSYDYRNVNDLMANNYLYQGDAIGTDGKLPAAAGSGSIQAIYNSNEYFYALGNNTYYIETPTSTKTQEGVNVPLGYRIVGASIEYNYGEATQESSLKYSDKRFYVSATSWFTTYYLQTDGTWGTSKVLWENDHGRMKSGDNYLYVYTSTGWFGNTYYIYSTTDKSEASTFTFDEANKRLLYNNLYLYLSSSRDNAQLTNNSRSAATLGTENIEYNATNPAFTPAPYTLSLYGTDGNTVLKTVSVSEGKGTINIDNLNNDAFKFRIEGLSGDAKALIRFTLRLEALNPYINSMDIVCHSHIENMPTITQKFTANDFQMAGDNIKFYVPTAFTGNNQQCRFSFENIYSKYGDNDGTYPESDAASHHARYFFVKSAYWNTVAGDGKQYQAKGDEAYSIKASTTWCGESPFNYSNIDTLTHEQQKDPSALKEYAFSEALYAQQGGTFIDDVEIGVGKNKDCYLFTGDETRHNLAPTTAMEHRTFAYYKMNIELLVKDYRAACQLKKVYTTTCFNGNGSLDESAMYGATFKAYDTSSGEEIEPAKAYLTVDAMRTALADALREESVKGSQVLYLDFTKLYSVHMPSAEVVKEIKAQLNPNCLFYFPVNSGWNTDNSAQLTQSGYFRACGNIIITDKQPFYAPYKITVPQENYALYERKITVPMNGQVALATLMLPFTLSTTNGIHKNRDFNCTFSVNRMKPEDCLGLTEEEASTPGDHMKQAKFVPITEAHTDPNVPYMVRVETAPEDKNISFVAQEIGADIMPTNMHTDDYTFEGEKASGTIDNETYSFFNHASYAGRKLGREENVFYFAKNKFLNVHNLNDGLDYLYMNPFRGFYVYTTGSGAKGINSFSVGFSEGETTIIGGQEIKASLTITCGAGSLTLLSTKDCNVDITSVYGTSHRRLSLRAGEEQTVNVPAGIYVVNKKKVAVK